MMRPAAIPFLCILAACSSHAVVLSEPAPATFAEEPTGYENATVVDVIDGDTIEVQILDRIQGPGAGAAAIGAIENVRLIGIDTPESVRPGTPIECFGREASAAAKALLEGREVWLVKDVEERDQYDRLLRYVYIGEEMANARLVVNGYASVYTFPPNIRHADVLVQLQREAREQGRGLWSSDTCSGAE